MFSYLLIIGVIFSKQKVGKDSLESLSFPTLPSLNMAMDVGNCPFLEILDSFAKLKPNVGILNGREFRI